MWKMLAYMCSEICAWCPYLCSHHVRIHVHVHVLVHVCVHFCVRVHVPSPMNKGTRQALLMKKPEIKIFWKCTFKVSRVSRCLSTCPANTSTILAIWHLQLFTRAKNHFGSTLRQEFICSIFTDSSNTKGQNLNSVWKPYCCTRDFIPFLFWKLPSRYSQTNRAGHPRFLRAFTLASAKLKQKRGSAKKSESAERERKKREFAPFCLCRSLNWEPGDVHCTYVGMYVQYSMFFMWGCMYVSGDVCMYVGTYVGVWGCMYVCGGVCMCVGCMYICV
jgi:hypothetical protein